MVNNIYLVSLHFPTIKGRAARAGPIPQLRAWPPSPLFFLTYITHFITRMMIR